MTALDALRGVVIGSIVCFLISHIIHPSSKDRP